MNGILRDWKLTGENFDKRNRFRLSDLSGGEVKNSRRDKTGKNVIKQGGWLSDTASNIETLATEKGDFARKVTSQRSFSFTVPVKKQLVAMAGLTEGKTIDQFTIEFSQIDGDDEKVKFTITFRNCMVSKATEVNLSRAGGNVYTEVLMTTKPEHMTFTP